MTRGGDLGDAGPFLRPEDLHIWLISLALLMVLNSSLAFVSSQFSQAGKSPWIDCAILVTWGVVFSLCVLLWYVNRLLNTEKAEWRLLFFSLACVVVPRSVLPFGFVDFTMLQMCLVGIAFFNGRRSCMTHVFCGVALVVMTVSDLAWGVLPLGILVLKLLGSSLAVVIGNVGYCIVQVFHRQVGEAKGPSFPLCPPIVRSAVRRMERGRSIGPYRAVAKDSTDPLNIRCYQKQTTARAEAIPLEPPSVCNHGSFRLRGDKLNGCSGAVPPSEGMRRYWTHFDTYLPLYLQAVHHRQTLHRDGEPGCVTKIEDTGIWREEGEQQFFVVPRGYYGYVDCNWYLDVRLPGAFKGILCLPFISGVGGRKVIPSRVELCSARNSPAPSATVCSARVHFDLNCAVAWYSSPVSPTFYTEHCSRDGCTSAGSTPQSPRIPKGGKSQLPILEDGKGCNAEVDVSKAAATLSQNPIKGERARRALGLRSLRWKLNPVGPCRSPQGQECFVGARGKFVTNSKSTMRRKGGEGVKLGSKSTHEHFLPLHGGRHLCGCVPHPLDVEGHGVEREAGWSTTRGSGQEAVMPKIKLGVFEDSAVERWYLLWRAEYIVAFYKGTCHINLFMCALQCVLAMTKRCFVDCLFVVVEKYDVGNVANLSFSSTRLQKFLVRILAAFWRPLLQFAILSALIVPMKFMGSRRGKDGWKFQLLAAGQATTYMAFVFFELLERCSNLAPVPVNTKEATFKGTVFAFLVGGHLIFPLFSIALTVHLRLIPEAIIVIISAGSAVVTTVVVCAKGWEFRVVAFYLLSRNFYALFAIMLVRAFENVRRRLFAAQALPFLMYLSALANSERVDNFPQTAEQNHSDYQNAKSFIKGRQRRPSSIWEGSVVPKLNGSPWRYGVRLSPCRRSGIVASCSDQPVS